MVRVREKPETQRARILDAARAVFARDGFGQATIDDIARETKIRRTLLYHYFAGKEEILEAVTIEALDELEPLIDELTKRGGTVEEQVRSLIDGYHEIMSARPGLAQLLIDSAGLLEMPAYGERIGCLRRSLLKWAEGLRPWIREVDREQFLLLAVGALFIWFLPTPFARAFGADPAITGPELERHKAALCDLLLHGLAGNAGNPFG